MEIIRNSPVIDTKWITENDRGIYHAMNKGIAMASGKYLIFLNGGDHFKYSNSLEYATNNMGECDIYYFGLEILDQYRDGQKSGATVYFPKKLNLSFFVKGSLGHPSAFISAKLFRKYGGYDEALKICSDWKFFLLCIVKHECTYKSDSEVISVFYADGISSNMKSIEIIRKEKSVTFLNEFSLREDDIKLLQNGDENKLKLKSLRSSKTIKLLQHLGLLWDF